MRFTIEVSELNKALSGNVASRSTSEIHEHVLLEIVAFGEPELQRLLLTSTNFGLQYGVKVPVESVEVDGACTALPRQLKNAIAGLQGVVEIKLINGKLSLTQPIGASARKRRVALDTLPTKDFPTMDQKASVEHHMSNDQTSALFRAMRQVEYAMATKDVRYYLNGMLLGQGFVAATDGHRLACCKLDFLPDQDIIIPREAVSKIIDILEDGGAMYICNEGGTLSLVSDNYELATNLINHRYPSIENHIRPIDPLNTITINKADMANVMDRAGRLETTKGGKGYLSSGLSIKSCAGMIRIQGKRLDDYVVCDADKDDIEIGVDANYVAEMLSSIESDTVIWERYNKETRQLFRSPGSETLHVIMPMRL